MQYKPCASHHAPHFLSRTDNDAAVEDINDDIPCFALAETANGLLTGKYTGTDMPAPVEYADIVETQQTDAFCVELAKRVAHQTAKAFFQDESHCLYRRAPYGDQLVIPESLRERILTLEHHATVSAHPGMNRMYYAIVGSRAHRISAASHCSSAAFRRPSHFRKLHMTGLQMSSYASSDAWILCKAMSSV